MNRLATLVAIASIGACHIISGGDEIVVEDEDGSSGSGNGSSSSSSSTDSTSSSTVGGGGCMTMNLSVGDPVCESCVGSQCCSEVTICDQSTDCVAFVNCALSCGGDGFCLEGCDSAHPVGATELWILSDCIDAFCFADCPSLL